VTEKLLNIPGDFWYVLSEMAPYLLLGFLVAGLLAILIKPETVEKHLGGKGIWKSFTSSFKATLFGVPLPLCSCGVIPVAASLRRHGANRGATTAFLISTPQTGVDSIAVTYSLMGPVFAVYRPLIALISGVIGGAVVSVSVPDVEDDKAPAPACTAECCAPTAERNRFYRIFRYGFIELPQDIGKALLIGLVIAALITALLPQDFFASYLGTGIFPMIVVMAGAIPFYVCATGSVPMAIALIWTGMTPGAALVFLMTGPATNMATIATIWKVMGKKTAIIYLLVIAIAALGFGLALDMIFDKWYPEYKPAQKPHHMEHGFGAMDILKSASAVILLGLLAYGLFNRGHDHGHGHDHEGHHHEAADAETVMLKVKGMTCTQCAQAVRRELREMACVLSVSINPVKGDVVVTGAHLDKAAMRNAVESLGYTVAGEDEEIDGGEPCENCAHAAATSREEKAMTVTLQVKGMTCNHCVNSVTRAMNETPGVTSASVDLKNGRATAEGSDIDAEQMKKAIEGLGYTVTETS
jgi:copper ion binding protein